MKTPLTRRLLIYSLGFLGVASVAHAIGVLHDVIGVSATAQSSPPQITIGWQPENNPTLSAVDYKIWRLNRESDNGALTSTDGVNWSPLSTLPQASITSVAYGTVGATPTFVAAGQDRGIYRSTDGVTWAKASPFVYQDGTPIQFGKPWAIAIGNGRVVTQLDGKFYSSTDAVTWTATEYLSFGAGEVNIRDLKYANSVWVAVGMAYLRNNLDNEPNGGENLSRRMAIFTSTNGTSWTTRLPTTVNWTPVDTADPTHGQELHGVAYGTGNTWVSVGLGGNIYRSTNNGAAWTRQTSGTTAHLYGVAFANGVFVAGGASANLISGTPALLRSTDNGVTWSPVSLGGNPVTRQSINTIRADAGVFYALGDGGTLLQSTDGLTWTTQPTNSTSPLQDLAIGNGRRILASERGWGRTPLMVGIPATTFSFADTTAQVGVAYDYTVVRKHKSGAVGSEVFRTKSHLTSAAIALPIVESRGTVALVVENTLPGTVAIEYNQFRKNLTGDGWKVQEILVPRALSSPNAAQRLSEIQTIRTSIQAVYNADPSNVRAVILLGRVPVPMSGSIAPDGHELRPFPADVYYGDMTGTWTDTATKTANGPNDGMFDQDSPPVPPVLTVGRIDFGDLPAFPLTETELIKRYLVKNHKFRHGLVTAQRKAYAANAWGSSANSTASQDRFAIYPLMSFSNSLGFNNITYSQSGGWTTALTNANNSFLMSYGAGGGTDTSAADIVNTTNFVANDYKTFFMAFYGSYFGAYQRSNNLLRSSIGMLDYGLTAMWASPAYLDLALGTPIGLSRKRSTEDAADSPDPIGRFTSIAIYDVVIGDPTLRIFPVISPTGASVTAGSNQNQITWNASSDTNIVGYHVYRAPLDSEAFTRLSGTTVTPSNPAAGAVTGLTYTDSTAVTGDFYTYMLRAVKLEVTNQGSSYNLSQGVTITNTAAAPPAPVVTAGQTASGTVSSAFSYQVVASNTPASYALSSGSLPTGITLSTSNGLLSGTPSASGTYTPSFTATNSGGTSPAVALTIDVSATAQGAIDVTNGLSARLTFDETSGTSAADSTGNGKTGTLQTGASFVAGKVNNGVSLNGSSGYVAMPFVFNPATQADLTVTAWVRLTTASVGPPTILQQEDGLGRAWLYRNPAGQLASFLGNAETTSNATLETGIWYHVALVKTGSSLQLYVNGAASGSPTTRTVESCIGAMRVGTHKSTTNQYWNGLIDEVRYYNRALSGSELATVAAWSPTAATGVQAFRTAQGLAANGSQDLLTPAGDGVQNLLKYAFNMIAATPGPGQATALTTPNAAILAANGTAGLPLVGVGTGPDTGKLQITYIRRKASATPTPGITYAVEFSDALTTWAVNPLATATVTDLGPTFERVTVTDSVSAPTKRFVRVRVNTM